MALGWVRQRGARGRRRRRPARPHDPLVRDPAGPATCRRSIVRDRARRRATGERQRRRVRGGRRGGLAGRRLRLAVAGRFRPMSKPLGPYSPFVRAGDFVIVSGQGGMKDGTLVDGGVTAQTTRRWPTSPPARRRPAPRCRTSSRRCASSPTWARSPSSTRPTPTAFGDHRPARSTVEVSALPGGMAVEVEAWAYKPAAMTHDAEPASPLQLGRAATPPTSSTTTPSGACPSATPRRLFEFLILEGAQAGPVVVDDPAQARGLPRGVRRLRPRGRRRVRRRRRRPLPRRPGHRAQPGQGRRRRSATPGRGSRSTIRSGFLWSFVGRHAGPEPLDRDGRGPGDDRGVRRHEQGAQAAGFRFVGPTICYALMQACGLVNDHVTSCFRHAECAALA